MRILLVILAVAQLLWPATTTAADTTIQWTGGCYDTQVYASGLVTLTKTFNGTNYDVELAGDFTIYSPTYGYSRHELPPGFLPTTADRSTYVCTVAINDGVQRPVSVAAPNNVESADIPYENGYLLFPDKFFNGHYALTCQWQTNQDDPPAGTWEACAAIPPSVTPTATSEPTPAATATPAPTATDTPTLTATLIATDTETSTPTATPTPTATLAVTDTETSTATPAPTVTDTPTVTPTPTPLPPQVILPTATVEPTQPATPTTPVRVEKLYLPQAHAQFCLPGSCN